MRFHLLLIAVFDVWLTVLPTVVALVNASFENLAGSCMPGQTCFKAVFLKDLFSCENKVRLKVVSSATGGNTKTKCFHTEKYAKVHCTICPLKAVKKLSVKVETSHPQ